MNYALAILIALQRKHIYTGTVHHTEVKRRRAKNKAAKRQRKLNRNKI